MNTNTKNLIYGAAGLGALYLGYKMFYGKKTQYSSTYSNPNQETTRTISTANKSTPGVTYHSQTKTT